MSFIKIAKKIETNCFLMSKEKRKKEQMDRQSQDKLNKYIVLSSPNKIV